ncbi:MAG: hypothetical protein P4L36_14635 [Holophaga sp.]|nr:hypothetical protein [Holophaga sp.]
MASYDRLGSFLLADVLAAAPYGTIHRALSLAGSSFERHHLVCTFTDELVEAGLAAHGAEIQRVAAELGTLRGFPANCQFESGKPPFLSCDYVTGRSLAQVLDKTREEQVPLGVDHALSVVHSMAQAIIQMHDRELRHGALSPHSVWVSNDGAVQILDAPIGPVLRELLPRTPALKAALEPYRRAGEGTAFQQDLFSLGAVLYELLTLERLPAAIPEALGHATLKAAQEEGGIPEQILGFLQRLLMVGQPFTSAAELGGVLEQVLYDGDYSPTTFNMAFLMHTLFREENEADTQAMKQDQGTNFAPYLPAVAPLAAPRKSGRALYYLLAAGAVVVAGLFGGLYYQFQQARLESQSQQAKLAALQRDNEAATAKLADIAKQEEAQKALEDMFGKQAEQATTQEARASAQKELEAVRQKTKDLAKQRADALRERQKLAQQAQNFRAPIAITYQPAPTPAPAPVAAPSAPVQDSLPVVTQKGSPQIPRGARESLPADLRDSEIRVSLKVFVDGTGRPLKVVILKGVDGGYNDSAQNAALASTYAPGSKNGKPASGWLNMEFNFGKPR